MKKNTIILLLLVFFSSSLFTKPKLADFGFNVYSQFGEDGIIQKIFEIIGTQSKVAVEFGAWDGFYLSNTANLWGSDFTWHAILIEGDEARYEELCKKVKKHNAIAIRAWVGIGEKDNLEYILASAAKLSKRIDLLCIDIDGNDYHIFNSLRTIRPRVIVCEYNPTIPAHYDVYAPYSNTNNFGQSVAALHRIAFEKGYRLVALTTTNAFFVTKEEFDKFAEYETDLQLIAVNDGFITLSTTYDGKYILLSNGKPNYFYGAKEEMKQPICGQATRFSLTPLMGLA